MVVVVWYHRFLPCGAGKHPRRSEQKRVVPCGSAHGPDLRTIGANDDDLI